MTLQLELSPEVAERLRAGAALHGLSAETYASRLLEERLVPPPPSGRRLTEEEWEREFAEFEKEIEDIDAPDFPDEALRREHLYGDRGL